GGYRRSGVYTPQPLHASLSASRLGSGKPRKQGVSPKQRQQRGRRKEYTERYERRLERRASERELGLFSGMSTTKQGNRNHQAGERDRTKRCAEENSDHRPFRADRGADEGHQRD